MTARVDLASPSRSRRARLANVIVAAVIGAACFARSDPQLDSFVRAEASFFATDFQAAERDYAEAQASDASVEHRLSAALARAAIAWRIPRDRPSALARLSDADALHSNAARVERERSRLLALMGDESGAEAAARRAVAAAENPGERMQATVQLAAVIVDRGLRIRLDEGSLDASDIAPLREAVALLTPIVRAEPGLPAVARKLVTAATLAADGPALLEGWLSCYLVGTGSLDDGPLAEPRRTLTTLLPGWHGSHTDDDALVRALAGSAFAEEAAAVARSAGADIAPGIRSARSTEVVAYARWARDVRRITDEYYRQVALGEGDARAWLASFDAAGRELWPRIAWGGKSAPHYDRERLAAELDRRFGVELKLEKSAGAKDLHLGHRVVDERRTVRQYGREADVRFVALDGMVSNGYQSWAWDGRAEHGGWANASMIVQVRSSYVGAALSAWHAVSDPAVTRSIAEKIALDSERDEARGRSTPVAYFPSVVERMRRDASAELVEGLRATGLTGRDLQAAFVREYARLQRESSIFAHEGRHAIDQRMGVLGGGGWWWDREFRAKLSEVAFAPRPRLALEAIMFSNIGDRTAHGRANQRIMEGVLAWMREHQGDIAGLHPSDPLLPQLPQMSDAQLRAAFASMDPLRKGKPGPAADAGEARSR